MQSFSGLAMALGLKRLQTLLKHDDITATFTGEFPAVVANSKGTMKTHRSVFGKLLGDDPNDERPLKLAFNMLKSQERFQGLKIRDLQPILSRVSVANYDKMLGGQKYVDERFGSLATDTQTLRIALAMEAELSAREYDQSAIANLKIEAHNFDGEILILSDIEPHILIGRDPDFGWGNVLSTLQDYVIDATISQRQSTDLVGSSEIRDLAIHRIDLSLQRAHRSAEQIEGFQTVVFEGAGGLADAYNRGAISFEDALRLIDRSTKFREWLVGLSPDADVLTEYHAAIAKDAITDKLPVATVRFAFFTASGAGIDALTGGSGIGTAAGVGLSAFDTFVIDRLLKGWRPNMFVEAAKRSFD
ncbi:hypothetical protein [Brevundimonas mediterranea]|uniref:Uncharacterized protein n=1 Tax=Brevundimonas mediterranea TaxID=74329 RepID=A0A7W6F105_9CAUL|nr:hypothetical protein [Brevundimonas mediterranea]MBB3873686.1 hypothetical protein [Brevundimonas mediterranea]